MKKAFSKKNLKKVGKIAKKGLDIYTQVAGGAEDDKICINTKFGSICKGMDENMKTCVSTKFGSICTDKFGEDLKTCVNTKFGSICAGAEDLVQQPAMDEDL